MADQNSTPAGDGTQPVVRVVAQYIKDLSFENPNIERLMQGQLDNPQLQVDVNVSARRANEGFFESVINFEANATSTVGALYKLELAYGGMFKIDNMPPQALEPFLLINAPSLLFPFVRRLLADITREGGFPPLLIDPIDFATLYMKRKETAGNQAKPAIN